MPYYYNRSMNNRKILFGFLLITILIGYNYVINLPQALQNQIMEIHNLPTTQFNLLYSLQTLPILFLIIPLGILYDSFGAKMLMPAALLLVIGQYFMYLYTPLKSRFAFIMMIAGRVLQGIGAEVLCLGQGTLATKWMGNLVGLIVVLPEMGEIGNVFLSPRFYSYGKTDLVMGVGLLVCVFSFIASVFLYKLDQKYQKELKPKIITEEPEINCTQIGGFNKLFWILILICTVNESIYIPFMDNANTLVQKRFSISYEDTGYYLSLPFGAAMISTALFGILLEYCSKRKLALCSGFIGVISHLLIYLIPNTTKEDIHPAWLYTAFILFGLGLGSYYAVIYPLVGLTVKKGSRGTAYAIVAFVQAGGMSLVPEISAVIIQKQQIEQNGYRNCSLLFIMLALIGLLLSIILSTLENDTLNQIGTTQYKQIQAQAPSSSISEADHQFQLPSHRQLSKPNTV